VACPTDSLQRVQQLAQTEALLVPWLNAHVKKIVGAWEEFESVLATDPNLTHQGACAAVGVSVTNETIAQLSVWPNPSTGAVRIAFARRTGLVRLDIHDAAGRLVRRLGGVSDEMEWDGRNDEGALVPSGTYWIRGVTGQGEVSTSKIVRVR
jgi:flagellar hook assembly protein FlgD